MSQFPLSLSRAPSVSWFRFQNYVSDSISRAAAPNYFQLRSYYWLRLCKWPIHATIARESVSLTTTAFKRKHKEKCAMNIKKKTEKLNMTHSLGVHTFAYVTKCCKYNDKRNRLYKVYTQYPKSQHNWNTFIFIYSFSIASVYKIHSSSIEWKWMTKKATIFSALHSPIYSIYLLWHIAIVHLSRRSPPTMHYSKCLTVYGHFFSL